MIEVSSMCKLSGKCASAMKKIKCNYASEVEKYLQPSSTDVLSNPAHTKYCMKSKFIIGYMGGWNITTMKADFMNLGISSTIEKEFSNPEEAKEWTVNSKHKFRNSFIVYTGKTPNMSATS